MPDLRRFRDLSIRHQVTKRGLKLSNHSLLHPNGIRGRSIGHTLIQKLERRGYNLRPLEASPAFPEASNSGHGSGSGHGEWSIHIRVILNPAGVFVLVDARRSSTHGHDGKHALMSRGGCDAIGVQRPDEARFPLEDRGAANVSSQIAEVWIDHAAG